MTSHNRTLGTSVVKGAVFLYRLTLKPLLCDTCLFHPTCSAYMIKAIDHHGWKGVWMGIKRVGRCHPWGRVRCFHDPVPLSTFHKG